MHINVYLCNMIYPHNFESKIGFNQIRTMLKSNCLSTMGKELVDAMSFSTHVEEIRTWLQQINELSRILTEEDYFPLQYFYDMRPTLSHIRLENTHIEEEELFHLRCSLQTIAGITQLLRQIKEDAPVADDNKEEDEENLPKPTYRYPTLQTLTVQVVLYPNLLQRIDQILDKLGHIRDNASPTLAKIRGELKHTEGSVSRTLNSILRSAQSEGLVDKDATPTLRDGRLVIPIVPRLKRKIKGIVHDESATGKTIYIEPTEVVEANNRIRELEAEERKEVIRILTTLTSHIRPHIPALLQSYKMLAKIEVIYAKRQIAKQMKAITPEVFNQSYIDWVGAVHPLLSQSLEKQGKKVVPLDIMLTPQKRVLIISGPNAGGKSVCLKTACLLQYMLQCGLCIPVSEKSKAGIFDNVMIDIGDEQSIENDLSTYSSHLLNMKNMMKAANNRTLLLIDEFGTGTEPQIGGAIAEAVLQQFCNKKAWAIITTHYQNLKHFADKHQGVVNGAMLYDRHEMRALFQLAIGQPGSSFAIEISRKIGLPEQVIQDASNMVGTNYIQSDKYLQDIVRDKRYWENKRQTVHQCEKDLEKKIAHYEEDIKNLEQERKMIIKRAKQQVDDLFKESNRRIENAIREIREKQAEKEATRKIRENLKAYEQALKDEPDNGKRGVMSDEDFAKKVEQIKQRKERREKQKNDKQAQKQKEQDRKLQGLNCSNKLDIIAVGDRVRIIGLTSVGTVQQINDNNAVVIFGDIRTKMRINRLERAPKEQVKETLRDRLGGVKVNNITRTTIDEHRKDFKQELDVRGMRGDDALLAVQHYIDDAVLMDVDQVRILHGKGNGILRQLIRQYLSTVPNVANYCDEHVQFGGAGITVVEIR